MKNPTAIFMNLLLLIALAFPVFAQHEEGSQPIALKTSTRDIVWHIGIASIAFARAGRLNHRGEADRPRRKLARA